MNRREVLQAGLGVLLAGGARAADAAAPTIIDTHTHFYDPTRPEGVPWPGKDDKALYRPVLPPEYKKLARPLGITGTVVVEASPRVEDNQWLLDLAKDEPFLLGIVGNLSPTDADFAKHLARFAKNPLFRGVRWSESQARTALTDEAQFARLKALSDNGLTLDLNGGAETFHIAVKVAEKLPELRLVVNHMGNPMIDGKDPAESWRKAVAAGGQAGKNVWCKLSALVEGSRRRDGMAPKDLAFYRPVMDRIWDAFGVDRLMFGSNWPVCEPFGPLSLTYDLVSKYARSKNETAFAKVFGTNAKAAYQLTR